MPGINIRNTNDDCHHDLLTDAPQTTLQAVDVALLEPGTDGNQGMGAPGTQAMLSTWLDRQAFGETLEVLLRLCALDGESSEGLGLAGVAFLESGDVVSGVSRVPRQLARLVLEGGHSGGAAIVRFLDLEVERDQLGAEVDKSDDACRNGQSA